MKNREVVKITSIALALISMAVCLFIWGRLSGFEKGYFYGVFQALPQTGWSGVGERNYFQFMNMSYFIIAFGFCIYIVGKFLKPLVVSSTVCILALSISIYPFWDMFAYKNEILSMKSIPSYYPWLNSSIYFDCFLLFTAVILIFIQITLFITRELNTERFKIN